jgi:hypothetical protein
MDDTKIQALLANLENMNDEEMAAALAQLNAPEGQEEQKQTPPPAQPVSVTMPDGTRLTANSPEELNSLIQAHRPAEPEPQRSPQEKRKFDMKQYSELFLKNPGEAQDYLDETRFGAPTSQLIPQMGAVMGVMAQRLAQLENAQYEAKIGDASERKVVDGLLKEYGWNQNQQNRDAAYELAKARGLVGAKADSKPEPKTFIPPRTGGGSPDPSTDFSSASNSLSDKQIEELLMRSGHITSARFH